MDAPEHRSLALEVAEQGITLLKNDRNILPLAFAGLDHGKVHEERETIKKLAVIGPNADNAISQLGLYGEDTPRGKTLIILSEKINN